MKIVASEKTLPASADELKIWAPTGKESKFNQPYRPEDDFDGPTETRTCTDLISLTILGVVTLASTALALYGTH